MVAETNFTINGTLTEILASVCSETNLILGTNLLGKKLFQTIFEKLIKGRRKKLTRAITKVFTSKCKHNFSLKEKAQTNYKTINFIIFKTLK